MKEFIEAKNRLKIVIRDYINLFTGSGQVMNESRYNQIQQLIPLLGEENASLFREKLEEIHSGITTFISSRLKKNIASILDYYTPKRLLVTLGALNVDNTKLKEENELLKAQVQNLQQQLEAARTRITELEAEVKQANQLKDAAIAEKNQATEALEKLQAALQQQPLETKKNETKRENPPIADDDRMQEQVQQLTEQLEKAQSDLNLRTSQLLTTKQQLADSKERADTAEGIAANLTVQNEQLITEKAEITMERDAAIAENAGWREMRRNVAPSPSRPASTPALTSLSQVADKKSAPTKHHAMPLPRGIAKLVGSTGGNPATTPSERKKPSRPYSASSRAKVIKK